MYNQSDASSLDVVIVWALHVCNFGVISIDMTSGHLVVVLFISNENRSIITSKQ